MINLKFNKKGVVKNKNSGITLIALVITVIVLLILAGISISMLSGNNGILQKATDAKTNTEKAGEKEQIQIEVLSSYSKSGELEIATVNSNIKSNIKGITTDNATEFPLTVTYTSTGNKYEVYSDGTVNPKGPSIETLIKIGDYINYDPMYLDIAKTQRVDSSKLTYISPTGSGTSHGNGYTSSEDNGGQTYTANSDIKWRVLNISNNKVELISEEVIKKDATNQNSGNFVLNGAVGYLYAEQELNEICKIYGYGYGADTSIVTEYNVGGPLDNVTTNTINNSGARSITADDVNTLAKISSYTGETNQSGVYVYYPTVNTSDGVSTTTATGLGGSYYYYESSEINDSNIRSLIFNEKYFLASRYKVTTNIANFGIYIASNEGLGADYSFRGRSANSDSNESREIIGYIRPIVTINSSVIDTSNVTQNSDNVNVWSLK